MVAVCLFHVIPETESIAAPWHCFFGRFSAPAIQPFREFLARRFQGRLGPTIANDYQVAAITDLLAERKGLAAMYAYGQSATGHADATPRAIPIALAKGGAVAFYSAAHWDVFSAHTRPGALAPGLSASELTHIVAELYDLSTTKVFGSHLTDLGGRAKVASTMKQSRLRTRGEVDSSTLYRDVASNENMLIEERFSVPAPVGNPVQFATLVLPLPEPMVMIGPNFGYQATDALVLTLDNRGTIVGVSGFREGYRANSREAAEHYLVASQQFAQAAGVYKQVLAQNNPGTIYHRYRDNPRQYKIEMAGLARDQAIYGHPLMKKTEAESVRRQNNLRSLLPPLTGDQSPPRQWQIHDAEYKLFWEDREREMQAPEATAVMTLLRRAEQLGVSGKEKAWILSRLEKWDEATAEIDEFLKTREMRRFYRMLSLANGGAIAH